MDETLMSEDAAGENRDNLDELRQKLRALEAENQRLHERQRRLMDVLNCKAPEKLEHDLRNVMNELNLLRALVETEEKQ